MNNLFICKPELLCVVNSGESKGEGRQTLLSCM